MSIWTTSGEGPKRSPARKCSWYCWVSTWSNCGRNFWLILNSKKTKRLWSGSNGMVYKVTLLDFVFSLIVDFNYLFPGFVFPGFVATSILTLQRIYLNCTSFFYHLEWAGGWEGSCSGCWLSSITNTSAVVRGSWVKSRHLLISVNICIYVTNYQEDEVITMLKI